MWQEPELVLHGGSVISMRGDHPDAAGARTQAIAVSGGRVAAVGSDADILALAKPHTRRIDLRGRAVLPGFQDPHAHPLQEGIQAGWLDLRHTSDRAEALRLVSRAASEGWDPLEPERWVEATYHTADWRAGRHPTRDELDLAAPDVPVLLHHGSGHAAVANSLALALAGLTATTQDPAGATIERDEHGEPTGLVLGANPVAPFTAALPPLTPEALRRALRLVAGRLAEAGVTAISEADLGAIGSPVGELAAYAGAAFDREFPFRLTVMPGLARLAGPDDDPPSPADIAALIPRDVSGFLRVGPAKFFADGALTTGDAWLRDAYADVNLRPDDATAGRPAHDPAELAERLRRADAAGWQIATHAIGDAGIEAALSAYQEILGGHPPGDHRHRIEHAMLLSPDLLARMVELGIAAVIQPGFVAEAGDMYRERLGAERAARIYAYRAWLDAGLGLAFSSDRPFGGGAPLDGIRAAFRHAGSSGTRLAANVEPTVAEALRAWTAEAAWVARDEGQAGRLIPGLSADLVILSGDPTTIPADRWAREEDGLSVVATLIAGDVVYGTDALD
jgi:predicted amidohydrolase YtcJ